MRHSPERLVPWRLVPRRLAPRPKVARIEGRSDASIRRLIQSDCGPPNA